MCCARISRATLPCSMSFPRALLPRGESAEDHWHGFKHAVGFKHVVLNCND